MSGPGPNYTAGYCAAVIQRYWSNPDVLTARLRDPEQRVKLAEFNSLVADTASDETKQNWVGMLTTFITEGDADNEFIDTVPAWFARLDGYQPPEPPATGRRGGGRRGRRNGDTPIEPAADEDVVTFVGN